MLLAAAHRRGGRAARVDQDDCCGRCATCPTRWPRCSSAGAAIAEAAHRLAPAKRYWAVVGNGANRIAAAEVRIKLSELCYKSIACDFTEDKKHIDLSSEPLILVCAAGLSGSTADDVAKEVAIYRAHKASPVVIATDGQSRFAAALARAVRARDPPGAGVRAVRRWPGTCSATRRRWPSTAWPGRCARPGRPSRRRWAATVRRPSSAGDGEALLRRLRPDLRAGGPAATSTACGWAATTASSRRRPRCAWRRCSATCSASSRSTPTRSTQGKVGTPAVIVDDLTAALTQAIEELTRPVDAIKHQAKTVTVGISRTDETLLEVPLVRAGAGRRRPPRPAHLPHAAHAGRPQPGRGRGGRLHPLPHRGPAGAETATRHHHGGRPGWHRPRPAQPHRPVARAAGHQAPGGQRARGAGGPGPAATAARS